MPWHTRDDQHVVLSSSETEGDVVTMNSRAVQEMKNAEVGGEVEVALVYPEDAQVSAGKLSVCSCTGAAILGHR